MYFVESLQLPTTSVRVFRHLIRCSCLKPLQRLLDLVPPLGAVGAIDAVISAKVSVVAPLWVASLDRRVDLIDVHPASRQEIEAGLEEQLRVGVQVAFLHR